jgi:hypothetical protein
MRRQVTTHRGTIAIRHAAEAAVAAHVGAGIGLGILRDTVRLALAVDATLLLGRAEHVGAGVGAQVETNREPVAVDHAAQTQAATDRGAGVLVRFLELTGGGPVTANLANGADVTKDIRARMRTVVAARRLAVAVHGTVLLGSAEHVGARMRRDVVLRAAGPIAVARRRQRNHQKKHRRDQPNRSFHAVAPLHT